MFHYKGKRSKINTDLYEPDQLVADKNASPAVGGVDWTVQSSAVTPPVPPIITKSRKFNPSERYFENHPEVLQDKPGVKKRK